MSGSDARTAITDYLTAPGTRRVLPPTTGAEAHGPRSYVVAGKPFVAAPASVRIIKERGTADRRLCAVTFDDEDGRGWFYLVAAERDGAGQWVARPVGGGSGSGPSRPGPWLNFCGCWGRDRVYGGGRIHSPAGVGRVQLTLASGTRLSDDAEAGVALFFANDAAEPTSVDIYDTAGRLLATQAP